MLPAVSETTQKYLIYWLGAICTLAIYTILYRENRLYRLFEHFYIGLAVGFGLYINFKEVIYDVWWKAMMTESSGSIFAFDTPPHLPGIVLERDDKKEGKGCWKWDVGQAAEIRLREIVKEWGTPNYLKLWAKADRPVSGGRLTLIGTVAVPENGQRGTFSISFPMETDRWRLIRLELRAFDIRGSPFRPFEKIGKRNQLGEVTDLRLRANEALVQADATIFLDDLNHNIGYRWWWVFSGLFGLMFYTLFIPRLAWMSRLAMAIPLGLGSGYTFKAFVLELGPQIDASLKPLYGDIPLLRIVNNAIFLIVLLSVMTYFFFSIEHRHSAIRSPAQFGRWMLMVTFGIVFGNTVMGRFSLFISRADFLIREMQVPWDLPEWSRLLIVGHLLAAFLVLAYLSVLYERRKATVGGTEA